MAKQNEPIEDDIIIEESITDEELTAYFKKIGINPKYYPKKNGAKAQGLPEEEVHSVPEDELTAEDPDEVVDETGSELAQDELTEGARVLSSADLNLLMGVNSKDPQAVDKALKDGANPNLYVSGTVLTQAVANNDLETVKLLTQNGADINLITDEGNALSDWTPLMQAFALNEEDGTAIADYLLTQNPDVNIATGQEQLTVLHVVTQNKPEYLDQILEKGADVNAQTAMQYGGETALMIAAQNGNAEAMKKLLDAGALVSFPNAKGQTVLDIMAANKDRFPEGTYDQLLADITERQGKELLTEEERRDGPNAWQRGAAPWLGGWPKEKVAVYDAMKRREAYMSAQVFKGITRQELAEQGVSMEEIGAMDSVVNTKQGQLKAEQLEKSHDMKTLPQRLAACSLEVDMAELGEEGVSRSSQKTVMEIAKANAGKTGKDIT